MKLKRYSGNPILKPNPANAWEALVTTNPGAWYDPGTRKVTLLYRAAGNDAEHKIHFGLAESTDGYNFRRLSDQPVFSPSVDGFDAGCVEDPRIIKIGEWYYVTYAARPFPPGQYWLDDGRPFKPPTMPPEAPWILRANGTQTGLAMTRDFKTWIRAGRLTIPLMEDRDVIIFPEKINARWYMITRPSTGIHPRYQRDGAYAMWIGSSIDMLHYDAFDVLAGPRVEHDWESTKVGANGPPIKTDAGWVVIYHGVGKDKLYRLGALLLDLKDPTKVIGRTADWLMQPEETYETDGFYCGCVFPCGNVVIDGTLLVYYGGADRFVGVATCPMSELLAELKASKP